MPITKYATQLVENLAAEADDPEGFVADYIANVGSKEDNVSAIVSKIELGEGDAGIVYVTDAAASDQVTPIEVPDAVNVPADLCGRGRRRITEPGRGGGLPRLADRAGRAGGPVLVRLPAAAMTSGADTGASTRVARPGGAVRPDEGPDVSIFGGWTVRLVAGITLLFLGLPVVVLIARSILDGSLNDAITTPVVLDALFLSLVTTSISLVLSVTFGLPLAWLMARRTFRGSWLVETIVDLPIVLPPAVAGLGLLLVFGRRGLLGDAFDLSIPFTTLAVILAQTFVSAPFFIRSARTGISNVDLDLEAAARVDGASEFQVFRRITAPLAATALAAGLVMAWARALGEFGATIMFAGSIEGRTQTLPLVVYGEFQGGDLDASIAAAAILVLAAFGVLIAVRILHWGRALDTRGLA